MSEQKNKGCSGKTIAIVCAGIFIMVLIIGAFNGIGAILAKVPWWGEVILSIGFVYILIKLGDK